MHAVCCLVPGVGHSPHFYASGNERRLQTLFEFTDHHLQVWTILSSVQKIKTLTLFSNHNGSLLRRQPVDSKCASSEARAHVQYTEQTCSMSVQHPNKLALCMCNMQNRPALSMCKIQKRPALCMRKAQNRFALCMFHPFI